MKKLLMIIVLGLMWSGSAFTATIECISKNGEKETFTYNNEIIVSKAKSFSDVMFDGKSFTGRAYDYQRNILLIKNISTQWKILINTELNYVLISKYDLKKDETIDWIYKDCKQFDLNKLMQEKAHIFKLSIKDEASIVENISKLYKPELEKISTSIKNISNFIRVEFPYDYGKACDLITGYPLLNVSFKVKYHKLFEIEPKISFKSFLIYIETGLNFLDIKKPKIEDLKLILTDHDKALMEEKFEQSNIYKPLRELSSKLMGELTNPLATYLSKEE